MPRAFNGLVWLGFAGALSALIWAASGGDDPEPPEGHVAASEPAHVARCLACQSRLGTFHVRPVKAEPPDVR